MEGEKKSGHGVHPPSPPGGYGGQAEEREDREFQGVCPQIAQISDRDSEPDSDQGSEPDIKSTVVSDL